MYIDDALNISIDGSSRSRPRRGGVGVVFVLLNKNGYEEPLEILLPGYKGANSQQMELQAGIEALKLALKHDVPSGRVAISTDSNYVFKNYKNAMFLWPNTQWRRDGGQPVANTTQWKELVRLIKKFYWVEFYKTKGHSKDLNNRAADRLAKESAKNPWNKPPIPTEVTQKKTSNSARRGNVEMLGQRLSIFIVGASYLKPHRIHDYRYKVTSKGSKYFDQMDFVYSEEVLKRGHTYYVVMNDNPKYPKIRKVIREIV